MAANSRKDRRVVEDHTFLVSGLVMGIPAHLVFDSVFEANAWVAFCARQYPEHEVEVFEIDHYARLMPTRFEMQ